MPTIVISYRRSQSDAIAGRIRDRLAEHYGNNSVYIDIDSIPIGSDFREHIDKALSQADALVAIIGPKWLGQRRSGSARINDERDPVRIEIETALRNKIPIMPELVNGASMPSSIELPESIRKLADLNATEIDAGRDFNLHIRRLVDALDQIPRRDQPRQLIRWPRRRHLGAIMGGTTLAVIIGCSGWWLYPQFESSPQFSERRLPTVKPAAITKNKMPDPMGGPFVPPSPRSYWDYNKSLVYLEASGDSRKFVFVEPNEDLLAQGAQPGTLLFEGRRSGDMYDGRAYVFAGDCGPIPYNVRGAVLNSDQTVEVTGKAPIVDPKTCQQTNLHDERLVFNFRYTR